MKYQNFAIVFVLIVLPLSLVLSYYIQSKTDTMVLQTTYQTKLNDSTYDAVAAYQINSLNTQKVRGESIQNYVEASVNTFFTTLTTNMGMSSASKQKIQNYIPAILFTTYDGYYIYSPTKTPQVAYNKNDGVTVLSKDRDVVYTRKDSPEDTERVENTLYNELSNTVGSNIDNPYTIESDLKDTTDPDVPKTVYNYMVKPFIYYSAQYKESNFDFVASYTLDNYLTIYGKSVNVKSDSSIGDENFSKSGYLIDPSQITISGDLYLEAITKKDNNNSPNAVSNPEPNTQNGKTFYEAVNDVNKNLNENTHNNVRYITFDVNSDDAYKYINYYEYKKDQQYGDGYYPNLVSSKDSSGTTKRVSRRTKTGDEIISDSLKINQLKDQALIEDTNITVDKTEKTKLAVYYKGIPIEDYEAKEYYIKAWFFSKWIQNNFKDVEASSVQQQYLNMDSMTEETKLAYVEFKEDSTKPFDISNTNDPESEKSDYSLHKRGVVKNSIQYNLNAAISTFNDTYFGSQDDFDQGIAYRLPILKAEDWESVLNNICMVSFMQGIPCGTKRFNSYSVVKSNNNNTAVNIESMYFVDDSNNGYYRNDSNTDYHMYDCPKLKTSDTNGKYYADQSSEFKYDAKKIASKVESTDPTAKIVCFYDDSSTTYYKVDRTSEGKLTLGEEIPRDQTTSYSYDVPIENSNDTFPINKDLTKLPNGSQVIYIYDHKNPGCYDCIVSKSYEPIVRWYEGDIRRIATTTDNELIIEMSSGNWIYEKDGKTATVPSNIACSTEELIKRKTAIYTYLAKIINNLYKNNGYVYR